MDQFCFIFTILLFSFFFIAWGYKTLPRENWQIMAVIPREKKPDGKWTGLNLTFYGLLCANAYTFATALFIVLSASAGLPVTAMLLLICLVLAVCFPASKIIARLVEKKNNTLTVGGAVFAGTLASPWMVMLVNYNMGKHQDFTIPVPVFMSGICVAYAFGEGLGRMACISFGCCYGKPVKDCSKFKQKIFSTFHLTYSGHTKKIAYASDLSGEKTVPIQVITAILYCTTGAIGIWLFLNSFYTGALLFCLVITQLWRFLSEFFRADYRGTLKISHYQIMSLLTIAFAAGTSIFLPGDSPAADLRTGLRVLWDPWILIMMQGVWVTSFVHTGRSQVTGASLSFHIKRENI